MTTRNPLLILASVLRRRRPSPAPEPHRFYPIYDPSRPHNAPKQVPHD
ncbi:hypothetical protein [Pseudomonas putida]|nr:hypothetical protein [Pseudomonas putida]